MKKILLTLSLIIATSTINMAQGLSLGPELGYFKSEDAEGSVLFGAQARLRFSDSFALEGAIDYRKEKYDNDALEVTSIPVQLTALIYPIPVVYGAIGAGWYNTSYSYESILGKYEDTSQEFGYHFGGGVEIPLNKNLSLSGDIRYVFIDYKFEEIPGDEIEANFFVIKAALLINL